MSLRQSLLFGMGNRATGPPWAGNQRAEYASELATACETRARSLGLEALTRAVDSSDPAVEEMFEEALNEAVSYLPTALLGDSHFRMSRNREECERLAKDSPVLSSYLGDELFPAFSDEPTVGQYLAWKQFEETFLRSHHRRVMQGLGVF